MENKVVKIESLDHQGRGIAHVDGKVVFVWNALALETVEIEIIKEKKKWMEAKVVRFLESSHDRLESPCPYFLECGGCDLLHLNYQKQLEYKEEKVRELVKKFAGLDHVVQSIVPNDQIFGYRNKVVFQVDHKVGFYRKKSNQVVDICGCLLLSKVMNSMLSSIRDFVDLSYVKEIMVRESSDDMLVVFDVESQFSITQIPLEKFLNCSVLVKRGHNYEVIKGNAFLTERIFDYTFKVSPSSFFQVNKSGVEKLYQTVIDCSGLTGKENVLDLYCGTGTIGIVVSKKAKQVLGIEVHEAAVEDAIWNKQKNGVQNIEFLCGDTGTVLKNTLFYPDLVIVDPPRAGLDSFAIHELKRIHASKIIYVSCDPVTLSRDLKCLEMEYEVKTIIPVDMFSHTYHVECVCVLSLR